MTSNSGDTMKSGCFTRGRPAASMSAPLSKWRRIVLCPRSRTLGRGFTITEMLVVLAIIALVMGIYFFDYAKNSRQDRVKAAARVFQAAVIGARRIAVTEHRPVVLVIARTRQERNVAFNYPGDTGSRYWLYFMFRSDADAIVSPASIYVMDNTNVIPILAAEPSALPDFVWIEPNLSATALASAPPLTQQRVTFKADGSVDTNIGPAGNTTATSFMLVDEKLTDIKMPVRIVISTGETILGEE